MGTASEQIRVSDRVKRELEERRREGESFNDVIERMLEEERDLFAGFGAFEGTDRGEAIRAVRESGHTASERRIEDVSDARDGK